MVFGGTRAQDRSVSTYDQRHVIHGSAIYDLPFGPRPAIRHQHAEVRSITLWAAGPQPSWSGSNSGFPYIVYLSDTNQLGDLTHSARPDIVPGVPLVNPLYSSSCPIGRRLPALRESVGLHASAAGRSWATRRALSIACAGLGQNSFDMSVQKNINLGEGGSAACSSAWMR